MCRVEGCTNTDYYKSCRTICKQHKKQQSVETTRRRNMKMKVDLYKVEQENLKLKARFKKLRY